MIKRIVLSMILLLLCIESSQTQAVGLIIAAQSQCDKTLAGCTPLPFTSGSNLCTANCVLFAAPSYTDVTRFFGNNGTQCKTSSDGGVTWANCGTVNPLGSGGKEEIVGTADGAVLMVGRGNATGGGTTSDCIAKRSTDNGATFGSVIFVSVGEPCGGSLSGSTRLVCLSTGECVTTYADTLTGRAKVYRSIDNGQTWTSALTTTTVMLDPRYLVYDGNVGFNPIAGSGFPNWRYNGVWAVTANMPAGLTLCYGAMIMGGEPYYTCVDATITTQRKLLNSSQTVTATYTLPEGYTGAGQTGPLIYSPSSGIIYAAATVSKTTGLLPIGIWVSTDSGATFLKLYEGSTLANSMTTGTIWRHPINSCLYISGGNTPQFIKIC